MVTTSDHMGMHLDSFMRRTVTTAAHYYNMYKALWRPPKPCVQITDTSGNVAHIITCTVHV